MKASTSVACERMGKRERAATPVPFRDMLIGIAELAGQPCAE